MNVGASMLLLSRRDPCASRKARQKGTVAADCGLAVLPEAGPYGVALSGKGQLETRRSLRRGTLLGNRGVDMAVNTSKVTVRFAAFELDLRSGELRKDGAKP